MRGLTKLYCLACEQEGCLSNSYLLQLCRTLDASEECPVNLDLSYNYLGDAGSAALLRTVEIMRWVRDIDLRDCGAGPLAVKALMIAAEEHPNLRCVDLRGTNNEIFAISGRRLLELLRRCPKLVVRVNYDDFPLTLAQKLRACNQHNKKMQQEEKAAIRAEKMAAMPVLKSLENENIIQDVFYLPTHDRDGNPLYTGSNEVLLHLVEELNTYMEGYLESYQYVGRVAAQLAVDLGTSILPCIRATMVAVPPSIASRTGKKYPANVVRSVRAVDALLRGLRANPDLVEELVATRGPLLQRYISQLTEARGEYESLVCSRHGDYPSARERELAALMRKLYGRVAPTVGRRRECAELQSAVQRVRELPAHLLAQIRYFAFNNPTKTVDWAIGYLQTTDPDQQEEQEEEEGEGDKQKGPSRDNSDDNSDDEDIHGSDENREELPKPTGMLAAAMNDLREVLADPYTAVRYAVTRPLFEALPTEVRFFLCDLALRRGSSLFTPKVFTIFEKEPERKEGEMMNEEQQEEKKVRTELNDPFDIVRIFEKVQGRKELSDVICAFEEWYQLCQVECYDVTHVSREELISVMSSM
ncbi:uncharacterized protein TM35_000152750 [Trypanosoma theileri]|uniref:Uncharacterized protein n=1 Tax=Trypanosoma theileri TaxID=67003 RepID=A0A1X0NVW0_9TRYP|nr:uncharacterized protein TM35_000152750 [Trypanosoma theileri]ORC88844.1 hypothetical protein TM35_000152750 [Trypanosoma theileri]